VCAIIFINNFQHSSVIRRGPPGRLSLALSAFSTSLLLLSFRRLNHDCVRRAINSRKICLSSSSTSDKCRQQPSQVPTYITLLKSRCRRRRKLHTFGFRSRFHNPPPPSVATRSFRVRVPLSSRAIHTITRAGNVSIVVAVRRRLCRSVPEDVL